MQYENFEMYLEIIKSILKFTNSLVKPFNHLNVKYTFWFTNLKSII